MAASRYVFQYLICCCFPPQISHEILELFKIRYKTNPYFVELNWNFCPRSHADGMPLQRNRVKSSGGNITIENLRRSDFGYYQCVVSNEVATIVSGTQLVIEGTQPHAPYNVSGIATENSITITWMPGYSGGPDYKQDYTLWYREAGVSDWSTIQVSPSGSTSVTINGLTPGKTYEFQVVGKNALGDGMMSKLITIRTLGK